MRSLNLKNTDKVDLSKPLCAYCTSNYGREQLDTVRSLLDSVNSVRSDVCSIQGRGGSEGNRVVLSRYLGMCQLLEQRFPFGTDSRCVNVKFRWSDSFNPQNKVAFCSLQYEKACVAYNLACLHCNMGLTPDRSTPQGAKEAIKSFCLSAGIFGLIRDQLTSGIVGTTTADLSNNSLSMNVMMLLAQAQSCVYEKAVRDKLNRSLLSKLSCQVANYYTSAYNYALQLRNYVGEGSLALFKAQAYSYLAASHYQLGMAQKEEVEARSEGYGQLIARFKYSQYHWKMAQQLVSRHGMHLNLTALQNSISTEVDQLEKDNATVYLEFVPEWTTLPKLEMLSSVKVAQVSLQDIATQTQTWRQTFDRLVPANVRAKLDDYHNRTQSVINAIQTEANSCSGEANRFLTDKGLPFAVDNQMPGLPDAVWNVIQEVQTKGCADSLEQSLSNLAMLSAEAEKTVEELEKELREEEEQDRGCRQKFGADKWTRVSSDSLNSNYWSSLNGYKKKLRQAQTANQTIREKLDACKRHMAYMNQTREELTAAVPRSSTVSQDTPAKIQVRDRAATLTTAIQNIQSKVEGLKQSVAGDNITGSLMQARQSGEPYDNVVDREISKYDSAKEGVSQAVQEAKSLLVGLRDSWADYEREAAASTADQRTVFLKDIESSANALKTAFAETAEGLNFFGLLIDYLRTLKQQIGDWLYARREERQDCLANLQRDLSSSHTPKSDSWSFHRP
eukprot:GHVS01096994.1.p1 GENE.GHVS01096994.1~~GHVS01096994.1.p1  ORF type:complete len:731 (+),score=90.35 GHVS01096994.1:52-2244(+)